MKTITNDMIKEAIKQHTPLPKYLWEILVPAESEGKEISLETHRKWDAYVRELSNGLTVSKPNVGQWISPDNTLFIEKMIPVRIFCTLGEIVKIAVMTKTFYNQQQVMYYKISDEVFFIK